MRNAVSAVIAALAFGCATERPPQKQPAPGGAEAGATATKPADPEPWRAKVPTPGKPPELVIPDAIPKDERLWVPVDENVSFRPLCLCVSRGYWMNLLKVKKSGVLSRHRHPMPVHGFVLKGEWRYLEHDWVAREGGYVYEAPGETHTLVVDPHVEEMITLFQVNGAMIYVDPDGKTTGYDDVFTRIDKCRAHYATNGLGVDYIDQFIR